MSARNRSSKMMIFGIGTMAIAMAIFAALRIVSGPSDIQEAALAPLPDTPSEGPGAGDAMADRPGETMRALAEDLEDLKSDNQSITETVAAGIGGLTEKLQQLGDQVNSLRTDQADMTALGDNESNINRLREDMMAMMRSLREEFENRTGDDYPVTGGAVPAPGQGVPGSDGYVWFSAGTPEPSDGSGLGAGLASFADLQSLGGSDPLGLAPVDEGPPEPLPVYTIPADATLVRSRGLTALIGRVPLRDELVDPLPFKIVTGRNNLLANDHVLPELARAVWSGFATGDATLHCVSGKLTQVTFIFRDGTISTWPREDGGTGGIGWISDERGFPCIPGKFVSNLHENLGKITSSAFASRYHEGCQPDTGPIRVPCTG